MAFRNTQRTIPFFVANQKEKSISTQRVKICIRFLPLVWSPVKDTYHLGTTCMMVLGDYGERAFISGEQRPNFEGNRGTKNIRKQIFDFWEQGNRYPPTPGRASCIWNKIRHLPWNALIAFVSSAETKALVKTQKYRTDKLLSIILLLYYHRRQPAFTHILLYCPMKNDFIAYPQL